MFMDALERLSFGVDIVAIQIFDDMISMGGPAQPVVTCSYMAKGTLIGKEHYIGQAAICSNFWCTQEDVDGWIQEGIEDLRARKAAQAAHGNGSNKMPQGPTMPLNFRKDQK
jgi:hypothetical protein